MELVYLWVEEYKNIKKEGFNFSPRFKCTFFDEYEKDENGNEKLKDGCELVIENKEDEYVSVFPDNINVTAIVGENGSGKSSVYEILSKLGKTSLTLNKINNSFAIINESGVFNIIKNNNSLQNKNYNCSINTINFIVDELSQIDISLIQIDTSFKKQSMQQKFYEKFQDILKNDNHFFDFLDEDFLFNNYQLVVDIDKYFNNKKYESYTKENENIVHALNSVKNNSDKNTKVLKFILKVIYHFISDKKNIDNQNKILNSMSVLVENIDNINAKELASLLENNIFTEKNINSFLDFELEYVSKTSNMTLSFDDNIIRSAVYKIDTPIKNVLNTELLNYLYEENILVIDFFNEYDLTYNYLSLSSGEQSYIQFLTEVSYELIKDNIKRLYFCDEIENSLHPNWQKKMINNIIKVQDKLKIKYDTSFIFASHSPFLLSDIPKENVIFLEKGKQVYPEIETFGANIHTLLSHGFFMKDGLMGEFAKGKINEIIDFFQKVEKEQSKEKSNFDVLREAYEDKKRVFLHTQIIIGEDYLRQVIKNHLVEIEKILFKDRAKEKKIERLKAELKKLEEN